MTGKFVVSAFAMLVLVFMTDFAKISLATDKVRSSKKPETWNIGGFITVSVVLGVAMVAETLFLLWFGWSRFGLSTNNSALYFLQLSACCSTLPYSPSCPRGSVIGSGRRGPARPSPRRRHGRCAGVALLLDTGGNLPGLMPLPWVQTLEIFLYALVSCLPSSTML